MKYAMVSQNAPKCLVWNVYSYTHKCVSKMSQGNLELSLHFTLSKTLQVFESHLKTGSTETVKNIKFVFYN